MGGVALAARNNLHMNDLIDDLKLRRHVMAITKETRGVPLPWSEKVSAGYFGAMRALRLFDPKRGVRFTTFMSPNVQGEIREEWRRYCRRIKREAPLESLPDTRSYDGDIDQAENRVMIDQLLATLKPRHRYVVEQTYLADRTLEDVCADLGIGSSAACQLRANALKLLRERIRGS